jgi:hypothetical protein
MDLFHVPDNARSQQWFGYEGIWQTWSKPRGITMAHFLVLGSGAGGGAGCTGITLTQRGGGSAGADGTLVSLIIPAVFLPDALFILVAAGGAGGAAGNGGTGAVSQVAVWVGTSPALLVASSANASGAGAGLIGTNAAGGAASAGNAVPVVSAFTLAGLGLMTGVQGTGGQAGAATGSPAAAGQGAVIGISSGGGGCTTGNVDGAGGALNTVTLAAFSIAANIPGGAVGGGRGSDGITVRAPMAFIGATGGGANSAGTGGAGGNGATGGGGAGGGGGITGGAGGNGGNGLVVVTCF